MRVRSIVHGAISIVNAIPLGIGSALGITLKVTAEVEFKEGKGVKMLNNQRNRLVDAVIGRIIPKHMLDDRCLVIDLRSNIPSSYGLKSSSAVSNALSLALTRLIKDEFDDLEVINNAVDASLDAKVTITGAFDDASACYFGGFVVTDNYARRIIRHDHAKDLIAIILLPNNVKRSDPLRLKTMPTLFEEAIRLAKEGNYYEAMVLNGILVASILGIPYKPIKDALERGAVAASVSGNGPAIAALAYEHRVDGIKSVFEEYGKVMVSKVNNSKARVEYEG